MRKIYVIAHDMRSCHNVGSLLRTCEGLGIEKVYFTGYTPYPISAHDTRLPHIARKIDQSIRKTALGAEGLIAWEHAESVTALLATLRESGTQIVALEQSKTSIPLPGFHPSAQVALLLGREVEGIDPTLLALCDATVEIPMFGKKESFNVVQAAAMALYHFRVAP